MTDQRAVRLAHLLPHPLPLCVFGLFDVQRNQAVRMACHHRRPAGWGAQEVENESALRVFGNARSDRQTQRNE
jgi:hypothetical protein